MHAAFGAAPDGRITIWLFDSADDKRRWLGAAHVQIAKPWRREVYVQWEGLPHAVLPHELAHVFAGAWGDWATKIRPHTTERHHSFFEKI